MSLKKLIASTSMFIGLSLPLAAQTFNLASVTSTHSTTTNERLPTLDSKPVYTYKLLARRIKDNGKEGGSRSAGTVEIRENSVYVKLFFGIYKILYVEDNDSTFSTYQSTKLLWYSQYDKYVETITDSVRVQSIFTTKKENRKKLALVDSAYSRENLPLVSIIKQFLHNQNDSVVKAISLGKSYILPLYDSYLGKNRILTKADVAKLIDLKGDLKVELENPVYFYSTLQYGLKIPYRMEGKATIHHAPSPFSFVNGKWRIEGKLEKNK